MTDSTPVHIGYLSLAEAAEYVGVSERTLQREVQHRRLTGYRPCRGVWRFRRDDLDEWMLRGRIEATEPTAAQAAISMNPMRTRRRRVPRTAT